MHNRLSVWLETIRSEIRTKGVWTVIVSAVTAIVLGTLHHWFYGKTLELVERMAPVSLQPRQRETV